MESFSAPGGMPVAFHRRLFRVRLPTAYSQPFTMVRIFLSALALGAALEMLAFVLLPTEPEYLSVAIAPAPEPVPIAAPKVIRWTATQHTDDGLPTATGLLKIRSNRRAMIELDGSPRDFSPADLALPPGDHEVSATLPGRPSSRTTRRVLVEVGSPKSVDFVF